MTGRGEIEFLSASRAFLHTGQLAARVCRRAAGFTIVTPTAEVVDLGTEFSVDVDGDDETKLAVTEGAVKLTVLRTIAGIAAPPLTPMRVTAGQAMTVSRTASGGVVAQEAVVDAPGLRRLRGRAKLLESGRTGAYFTKRFRRVRPAINSILPEASGLISM